MKSGLLLLILDSGNNVRRHRKLYVALAEVGTGFTLWKDVVDYLSEYRLQETTFHTMHLSHDHNTLAGRWGVLGFFGNFSKLVRLICIHQFHL